MRRSLVLFSREPGREAREKGFVGPDAAELFARIAESWRAAAREAEAQLVLATPAEDLPAWRRRLGSSCDCLWVTQRGDSLGERLENAARGVAALGGRVLLVGGDVPASSPVLTAAFRALEAGTDAVLAPAPDGGVSLIGLAPNDLDLLRPIAPRRGDVFAVLLGGLLARRRRVYVAPPTPDVDGRRSLRSLLQSLAGEADLLALARRALERRRFTPLAKPLDWRRLSLDGPPPLRGPPAAA